MKRVRDPIHNYIVLEEDALRIVSTEPFQRLRRIHQLGTANLVYPGANHSRFEHSLGAYHLAREASRSLGLSKEEAQEVALAALLHDIGHGPFSHLTDPILEEFLGKDHVERSRGIVQGELKGLLEEVGADPEGIARTLGGEGELGRLVAGEVDVDRMDYLVRDSHYTGVSIGVDLQRLVDDLCRGPFGVAIESAGIHAAEMILVMRYTMHITVYFHPTCRVAEAMARRAVELALQEGVLDPEELSRIDDGELATLLRRSEGEVSRLQRALDSRDLMKVAYSLTRDEVEKLRKGGIDAESIGEEVERALGLGGGEVLVDLPDLPRSRPPPLLVLLEGGEVRPLVDLSPLVRSLSEAERGSWRARVCTWPGNRKAVREAVESLLIRGRSS